MLPKKNFHILPYLLVGNHLYLIISGYEYDLRYKNQVIEVAKKLGVENRMIITGPVSESDKYRYIRDCEIFAFPSLAEGFGLPVIEAMRFGKKTLLSRHTCLPEIGGDCSYYLDSDDPEYLIDFAKNQLIDIINENADKEKIINWSKKYSWDEAAKGYEKLYDRLLK
jgi:glycosyltransferase involved in cell wall biosynthesis